MQVAETRHPETQGPTAAPKGGELLLGCLGGGAPQNAGGCVGAQPPHFPPPKFEPQCMVKLPINRPGGRYVISKVAMK